MVVWMTALALAGALPTADVTWKGPRGQLVMAGVGGEHVAPEAPATVELMWTVGDVIREGTWVVSGEDLAAGLPLVGAQGASVSGEARLSLCQDDGTACRRTRVALLGEVPVAKKGSVALAVSPPAAEEAAPESPFRRDASEVVTAALEESRVSGRPVLLDFSAVWCPPCNLLASEVLHAPDTEEALSDVIVAVVDVDDPSSWTYKDQYGVGGYPTVVAVSGDGTEIDRLLGYDSREQTLSWIGDVVAGDTPSPTPEGTPEDAAPAAAAQVALDLLTRERDGWEPWLARARSAPELVETRLAGLAGETDLDDLVWLLANAPDRASDFVWSAYPLLEDHPAEVGAAAQLALRDAGPVDAADLLWLLAHTVDDDVAPAVYGSAAATLRAAFTGEPDRDRAHVTFLSRLQTKAGDLEGGLGLLDRFADTFPDEPTWAMEATELLVDAGRLDEALAEADDAVRLAWGDNALRAVKARAEVLIALDRADEARAYAAEFLATHDAPAEGVNVRTHRYRAQLAEIAQRPEIAKGDAGDDTE